MKRKPRIGLALGGGSARGWAHIGVIRALEEAGIKPDLVCGTSMGALVGAVYANGDIEWLEEWVTKLSWRTVVRMLDLRLLGGILGGTKLIDFLGARFGDKTITQLNLPFAAVATELDSGREIWLQDGLVTSAVRASIAIPGIFTPVEQNGVWLADGGLANPVPVSLARAMRADIVIAVDLNNDILSARTLLKSVAVETETIAEGTKNSKPVGRFRQWLRATKGETESDSPPKANEEKIEAAPSLFSSVERAINIMQVRITRSRLAGEPADIMLTPRLGHMGLLDFHRGRDAIQEGYDAVQRLLPEIKAQLPMLTEGIAKG
ncbi:MAG TPA: patatin-like phospholipase family protein [Burkholderiales bacterium]|nr:patatin-like phospholipase family protein [Burkholderiales bacterium]